MKCLNPTCENGRYARGLCNNCYHSARSLVSQGRVTWAKLEQKGKALPTTTSRGGTHKKDWFLS